MNLGDIITVADSEKCGNREFPVLSMTMHDGLVLQTDRFKKAIASKDLSGYKVVRRNQLVVSFPIDEGVLYIQDVVDAGIVSPAYAVWDVRTDMICPKFLGMFLRCPKSIQYYKAKLRGSTARRRTIPRDDFLAMGIPDLSISDQDRICAILEKIGSVIAASTKQIDILEDLVKSRFVEMFGDLNGSSFPRATIDEVCEVKSGGTPDRKVREYWENGDIPWVKTTELKNCELYDSEEHITTLGMNESSAKLVPPETILLAMYGQGRTRGMTAKLKIAATTNQACACILPGGKIDQDYLWHYLVLSYEKIRALAQGAGQPNLNGKMIRSFGVPLPPLALQREFAAFVAKVDKLAFAVRKSLETAEKLYRQQLSEAFS